MTKKIDPRIAQRRQGVARAAGRRRLRLLISAGVVVLIVLGLVGLARSPLLDVDKVQITGAEHTAVEAVLQATGLSTQGHAMVAVDRFALARKIERLPWIATAEVDRKWPNVVRVKVTERVAIGAIAIPGGVALLDATGRVLETAEQPPPGVIAITASDRVPGPGRTAGTAIQAALAILHSMSENLVKQTQAVHRLEGNPVTYEVGVQGGVTIRLGDATQIAEKLAAAEAVLAVQHAAGTVIDVRVPRSPAVTRSVTPR